MPGIHGQISNALFEHVLVAIHCSSFDCLVEQTYAPVPHVDSELVLAAMYDPVLDVSVFVGFVSIR